GCPDPPANADALTIAASGEAWVRIVRAVSSPVRTLYSRQLWLNKWTVPGCIQIGTIPASGKGWRVSEAADETLKAEVRGSLALVTLARPRALNALTSEMRAKLSERLWAFARDPQVYAVVLQSESPRAFSSGSDVRE